jgi:alkanesulfonate monooxygenase SsuD/methylene tetrahydromethanopterin reductase-like flavin-dependent oxidoreductase (luciferase family)
LRGPAPPAAAFTIARVKEIPMPSAQAEPIEFGWFMPAGAGPANPALPLLVQEAPAILPVVVETFDSIWVPDHFYAFRDPHDAWLECWTVMTWLLTRFPRIKVGPIVLGVGYRPPALLAKMGATLQVLSEGRFVMGIGAGWRGAEYTAYGYPFPPAPVRIAQLAEAVQILRLMWTQPAPTFQGRYFQLDQAYCAPRPDPPPPIMIGGGGEKLMLPLTGRLADLWDRYHGGSLETIDREDYARKWAIVRGAAAEAGRDPAAITQSYTIENGELPASRDDSAAWRNHLRPLIDLGVRQFILGFGPVTDPDAVRRLADEVLAPLREG